ncbi:MAG: TIGR00159 family protein [Lachnospiraceae bacterium]|nr:TIGR00159 family protein [Lachnospiraceae bacterium]MBD5511205.1 TIGR00159 family protein [Lachnospiraceae bacterium]
MIRRIPDMDLASMIEILIISFLIYHILIWIKNTRAWALLKGLAFILIFWLIAAYFHMNTILWLGSNILGYVVTALIIVMQPELRKALEELGNKEIISNVLPFSGTKRAEGAFSDRTINEIAKACVEMGKVKTGALIVIECKSPLGDFERTGIDVDGLVTSQLLINIFEHNTPLHDGAVIVRGNRVASATCYLPLSDNLNLDKNLGTRHRAGLGISEVTDAVTVIVSEETGKISVAYKGELTRNLDSEGLKEMLRIAQPGGSEDTKKGYKIFKGRSRTDKVENRKKNN